MIHRWKVISRAVNDKEIGNRGFTWRRSAERYKREMDRYALATPKEQGFYDERLGPLWTNEVREAQQSDE